MKPSTLSSTSGDSGGSLSTIRITDTDKGSAALPCQDGDVDDRYEMAEERITISEDMTQRSLHHRFHSECSRCSGFSRFRDSSSDSPVPEQRNEMYLSVVHFPVFTFQQLLHLYEASLTIGGESGLDLSSLDESRDVPFSSSY